MTERQRLTAYPQTSAEKEQQLEALLQQDPNNLHALKTLAFTYYTNHKYDRAIELYRGLMTSDGADPAVHFYMGNTYFRLKDYRAAIQAWQQSIAVDTTGIYRERAQQRIEMARSTNEGQKEQVP